MPEHKSRSRTFPSAPLYVTWAGHVVLATFLLFITPVLIYRLLVWLVAKIFRPDLTHLLTSHGSFFLADSVHSEPAMNMLVVYQMERLATDDPRQPQPQRLPLNVIVERGTKLLAERVVYAKTSEDGDKLVYPELQEYCVRWGGYFFWKREPNFCVKNHVRVHRLAPGQNPDTFRQNYMREPLPASKSPWQFLVLQTDEGAGLEYLFKYHHSLGDAASIMRLLSKIVDPDKPMQFLNVKLKQNSRLEEYWSWLTTPVRFVAEYVRFITVRSYLLPWPQIPAEPYATRTLHRGGGQRSHHMSSSDQQYVDLRSVKEVAARHGTSVTAVVYAALAGALRGHLVSKYGPDSIPDLVRFPQAVPYLHRDEGLRNILCTVTFELPLGESDPACRLLAIHAMIENRRKSVEPVLTYIMLQGLAFLPSWFPYSYTPAAGGAAAIGVTNFPGPLTPVAFDGRSVDRIHILPGTPPLPFYAAFFSYSGRIEWSVNGDTRVFSQEEISQIGNSIRGEFGVLQRAPISTMSVI